MSITPERVLNAAAFLVCETPDANPEYDRAISELVCDLFGVSMDHKEDVSALLRERQATYYAEGRMPGPALHARVWKETRHENPYPWFYEIDYVTPGAPKGDKSIDSIEYGSVETFDRAMECIAEWVAH